MATKVKKAAKAKKAAKTKAPKKTNPRQAGNPIPHRLPAGCEIEDFKFMYDAEKNAEDWGYKVRFADGHQELWHTWYRDGVGWLGPEIIATNIKT